MKILKLLFLLVLLPGCGTTTLVEPRTFDLGLSAPSAKLPAVRIASVRAVAPFESVDMHYRIAFRNAAEIAPYANSRWSAPPADLVRKQLLRASSEDGRCRVDVELQEFTQVFSSKETSDARLELRASLSHPAGSVSRGLTITEPNAGSEAATGAAALARAVDRAIGELVGWISAQPGCR